MGVGHAAVAVTASKWASRVNVGWLVFGSLLADLLLGVFVLMGWEHATAPADFATNHFLVFTFPYSHGLVPLLLWGAFFSFVASRVESLDRRAMFVLAAVVISHFVLDAIVHVVGLPLLGERSPKIGLGLWNHVVVELCIETLMAIIGGSRIGIPCLVGVFALLTWTQLSSSPPNPSRLAIFWIGSPVLLGLVAFCLDRKRVTTSARPNAV
jgi:hypothetical protein